MRKFWDWKDEENELRFVGPIDSEEFWGDEITPRMFREQLMAHPGKITIYINSPGGNVFAASEIYTMLLERKGEITVKIDAFAASAATIIAMAGGTVLMAPTAYMLIHDPSTLVMGNKADLKKAIGELDVIKEGLINAYELKSGLKRDEISRLMEKESLLSAYQAMELGLSDGLIGDESEKPKKAVAASGQLRVWAMADERALIEKRMKSSGTAAAATPSPKGKAFEPESPEMARLRARLLKQTK